MRRSGPREKGAQAERWGLHLGFINTRNHARPSESDLVAEPMARNGSRCDCCAFWGTVCRHLLIAACLMAGCIMVLDHAFLEPTVGIRNVTLDEPNHVTTTIDSEELETTTTLQTTMIDELDTFRAVFSVDFAGATERVVNVSLTTGEATLRRTNNATVDLQREWLAHRVLQRVQLALEQYNQQNGGALVGNGNQYDLLTSESWFGRSTLASVGHTPYRQAMQSSNPDAASQSNVLQRLKRQVLHFVSTDHSDNGDKQHRMDRQQHAGLLVTISLATTLLISSISLWHASTTWISTTPRTSSRSQGTMCIRVMLVLHSWALQPSRCLQVGQWKGIMCIHSRSWISDLVLWSSATEIDPARQGPIAALQVQGSAKELVRELTPVQLREGDVDQMTGQHITGLDSSW